MTKHNDEGNIRFNSNPNANTPCNSPCLQERLGNTHTFPSILKPQTVTQFVWAPCQQTLNKWERLNSSHPRDLLFTLPIPRLHVSWRAIARCFSRPYLSFVAHATGPCASNLIKSEMYLNYEIVPYNTS